MTVREYIEQNKKSYDEICYSSPDKGIEYSNVLGFFSDNTSKEEKTLMETKFSYNEIVEMNGCEFYLWLEGKKYTFYEEMSGEERENVRIAALEKYDYTEDYKVLIIFD